MAASLFALYFFDRLRVPGCGATDSVQVAARASCLGSGLRIDQGNEDRLVACCLDPLGASAGWGSCWRRRILAGIVVSDS